MSISKPSLEVCDIGRRSRDPDVWLFKHVSFSVSPGDRIAIQGKTGSGKTLLLRSIALLDPLDAGQIRWKDTVPTSDLVPEYRRNVMYLHQRPALSDGTVEENLRLPFTLKVNRQKRFDRDLAVQLLMSTGRNDSFLDKRSAALSGGEAQLTSLIRALQLDPEILLLDEITAALDPETTISVERMLDDWLNQQPSLRACIWVGHDRAQVKRVSNRLLTVEQGRIQDGSAE